MKRPVTFKLLTEQLEILSKEEYFQTDALAPLAGSVIYGEWFIRAGKELHEIRLEASHPRAGTVRRSIKLVNNKEDGKNGMDS